MESGILSNFSPPIHLSPANSVEGISKKGLQRYTDCGKIQAPKSPKGTLIQNKHYSLYFGEGRDEVAVKSPLWGFRGQNPYIYGYETDFDTFCPDFRLFPISSAADPILWPFS
jgi:hypothetical protein